MAKQAKYTEYEVHDFLKDEFFVRWARDSDHQVSDFWNKWITENPEKSQTVSEAKQLVQAFGYQEHVAFRNDEYIGLYEKILKGERQENKPRSFSRFYGIAASISLVALSLVLAWKFAGEQPEELPKVSYETKTTNFGEKLTVRLSDGSMVKMNAGSSIRYKEVFDQHSREVQLTGEAYFVVERDKNRPFVVKTQHMSVEALGTSFNINSYKEDDHSVTLITGKVGVGSSDRLQYQVLIPGQRANVKESNQISIVETDGLKAIDWSKGILSFEEAEFKDVIKSLERWYGVTISINGKVGDLDTFSGHFENERLESILDVLSYASGFSYLLEEKNVTIRF